MCVEMCIAILYDGNYWLMMRHNLRLLTRREFFKFYMQYKCNVHKDVDGTMKISVFTSPVEKGEMGGYRFIKAELGINGSNVFVDHVYGRIDIPLVAYVAMLIALYQASKEGDDVIFSSRQLNVTMPAYVEISQMINTYGACEDILDRFLIFDD